MKLMLPICKKVNVDNKMITAKNNFKIYQQVIISKKMKAHN